MLILQGLLTLMDKQPAAISSTKQTGFTLAELMVTLAIVAIIVTMGAIAISNNLKQIESKSVSSSLINFLTSAKQDALIYQVPVTACMANDTFGCVKTGGTQLISFFDKNNNNIFDAASDKLTNQTKLDLSWGTVTTNVSLNKTYIVFKPVTARPIGYMGNIQYCPSDSNVNNQFKVSFSITGIIKYKPYSLEAFTCP